MPVIRNTGSNQAMRDCWYPAFLNQNLALLRGTEQQDATDWINQYVFDDAMNRTNRVVNVTEAVRQHISSHPDWTGSPLQPLYARTGMHEERASWFYGNLVCRIGIHRPETWWVFKNAVGNNKHSSTYVFSHV